MGKFFVYFIFLWAFVSCSDEKEIFEEISKEQPLTMHINADMPESPNKTKAYMGNDLGVFWNSGDNISVFAGDLITFGIDARFTADDKSEGKKMASFKCPVDEWQLAYFKDANYLIACYPTMSGKERKGNNGEVLRKSTIPQVQTQNGVNSNHLSSTMFMVSGKVEYPKLSLAENNVFLPSFKFKHKTAVLRFRISNKRNFPFNIKSARVTLLKDGKEFAGFIRGKALNLETMESSIIKEFTNMSYHEVQIKNNGTDYYTINSSEDIYLYCSVFPLDLENYDLVFSVYDSDENEYKTLILKGSKIRNKKFEEGVCYTFNLQIDNNLQITDWEADYISDVNLGGKRFSISNDSIMLPLSGDRRATITINTNNADGWRITSKPEWITVASMQGKEGESQITLSASPNQSDRIGELCIASGNLRKTIIVEQTKSFAYSDAVYLKKDQIGKIGETCKIDEIGILDYIFKDSESEHIYMDHNLRSFQTKQPLQLGVTDKQEFHLRFYSPRKLTDVQIWATIPGVLNEEFLLAEIEELPPFADLYLNLPFTKKDCKFSTLNGGDIMIKKTPHFQARRLKLRATSSCEYWKRLQEIKINWSVRFFRPPYTDDKWDVNYIVKPAHCREAVALMLNNTYMFSSEDYKNSLFLLEGKLFEDDARQKPIDTKWLYYNRIAIDRPLNVGLTKFAGRASRGGPIWTFLEEAYLTHYADDIYDPMRYVIWHEFGHILGYSHDGNMTFDDRDGICWAKDAARMYHIMSKEKKLPIYSRRFMHTRDYPNSSLYGNKWKVNEWHSFGTKEEDDPELYEIDKGKLWLFNW